MRARKCTGEGDAGWMPDCLIAARARASVRPLHRRAAGKKYEWAPVGGGVVDWVGQFRAFANDGYHHAVSLETHWRGAGTPEASTRISMQGLKDALKKANIDC